MLTGDVAVALEAYRGVAAIATPGDPVQLAIATANQALTLAYAGDDRAARAAAAEAVAAAPSRSYGAEATRITTALEAVRRRVGDAAYDGA
jgi:hypothetical protein